ncbi:MAG: flavodoxin [Mailhella sp.]|nr:flavodoxin [Mailhella sp.]
MKVLIVYGSETGNTESLAEALGEQISAAGHTVKVLNAADASAEGLCTGYDAVLFGCSAWGTDEVELQGDFNALFEEFDSIDIKGKKAACFASGDSSFEHYCGAVDVIEDRLGSLGATLMEEGLRVEGDYSGNKDDVDAWGQKIIAAL